MYTIIMGDLNFIEQPEDHTSASPSLLLDHKTKAIWDRVLEKFNMTELAQPIHNYYHVTDSLETTRTSRIDRVYTSYSSADDSIVHPSAYIPYLPHTKIDDYDRLIDPSLHNGATKSKNPERHFTTDPFRSTRQATSPLPPPRSELASRPSYCANWHYRLLAPGPHVPIPRPPALEE
jgi:hypothetical protein